MRWFRFNIAGLIVFILICGVAFAALKESSDVWEHGVFSLTLLLFLISVLMAIHSTGARRGFWLGFALFGGCYLGLSLIPPVESRLISSQGLAYLRSKLPGQSSQNIVFSVTTSGAGTPNQQTQALTLSATGNQITAGGPGPMRVLTFTNGTLLTGWGSSPENFVRIGHSLLALLLAWLGGVLSRRLSRSRPTAGSLQRESDDRSIQATDATQRGLRPQSTKS